MRTIFLRAGLTLTALLTAGTAFGADPRLLNLVMPDATTLAGANVTNAETTPFGQFVLTQMTSAINQQLQAFVTATGFDPRHDVSEILAASSPGTATPSGLVLALGNFPVSQLTAAIARNAPQLTVQSYGGATLITGSGAKGGFSVAFLETTIAVVGDPASVKAAIDRATGMNAISPALNVQVQTLSTTEDAWVVTDTPVASLIPGLNTITPGSAAQITQLLNGIQASSGGVKFGSTVQITGQAVTSNTGAAKSLADVLQALISIATTAEPQNQQAPPIAQIFQALTVTASGTAVNVALSIPEAQIESIVNGIKKQAAVKPAVIKPAVLVAPDAR